MKKVTKQLRKLTEEEKRETEENIGLVHYIVINNFHIHQNSPDYEDIVSIGKMGLIKAVLTFKKETKIKFSTYAARCIKNEIGMEYRKRNKYSTDMHIQDVITEDNDGNKFTLENILDDPKANFIGEILEKQEMPEIMNVILNWITPRNAIMLLYKIVGKSQGEIAKMVDISQSMVCRIEKKSINKVRELINSNIRYKKVFFMTRENSTYQIKFPLENIGDIEEILPKILSGIDLKGLSVTHDGNEVTITMLEDLEELTIFIQIYEALYKNYPNFFDDLQ